MPLTYAVPEGMVLNKGDVVQVPIGRRQEVGIVWEMGAGSATDKKAGGKSFIIKAVLFKYDVPPLPEALQQFVRWVAAYSVSGYGAVLKMVLSVPKALTPAKQATVYRIGDTASVRMTAVRQHIVDTLRQSPGMTTLQIKTQTGASSVIIKNLIEQGVLIPHEAPIVSVPQAELLQPSPPLLSVHQQAAADALCHAIDAGGYSTTLLDGVTGSGKTEVYFAAIEEACKTPGAQVLVLLPEIILTAQWVKRFKERFGVEPVQWHSGLTPAKRVTAWRAIASGNARLVVGARSALFLPYHHLKLIIVDEEHDASFKQEEGVLYQGRDMAVVRGYIEKIPVILASATPSIETVQNVKLGKYQLLTLPGRFNASMPAIGIVDMRKSEKYGNPWISKPLGDAIERCLGEGQQVMLFLNRRGYAPLTLCKSCGHRFECDSCSGWLVRHESPLRLVCHRCGHHRGVPDACPACQAPDALVPCGPGIQRIAEVVTRQWPKARLALMDSDHLTDEARREAMIHDITTGAVDMIIGTQMIAKGHHFPHLSLVGIIDADIGLAGGDLRAAERCFQLLHQVSGRAGREKTKGHVLIQSYMPESSVIQALASGDRDAFVASELYSREIALMPPFARLVGMIITGSSKEAAETTARQLMRAMPQSEHIEVFGPVPAPLFVIRKKYRYRILVKAPLTINIQRWIASWMHHWQVPAAVSVKVDVDPYSFS